MIITANVSQKTGDFVFSSWFLTRISDTHMLITAEDKEAIIKELNNIIYYKTEEVFTDSAIEKVKSYKRRLQRLKVN